MIANSVNLSSDTPDFDPGNNASSATFTASNPPPVISGLAVNAPVLWPPDHTMRDITFSFTVTDNCGTPSLALAVASNEPIDAVGNGDGDTAPDWLVLDPHHLQLRAERAGGGSGRIYTLTITATDSGGGASSQQTQVSVPKN